ncbi:MAG: GNAT family N-acetyltransferase [Clostridia bacterium]|nr:GNAT family N-acetyltransferase [Clostridia bacterium]
MSISDIRIRSAVIADLPAICDLFAKSRQTMKEQGIDQWQDGYPFSTDIEEDMKLDQAYVLVKESTVVGYFAYTSGKEEVYEKITEGAFREDGYRYSSVHRVAVSPELRGHGLGGRVFDYATKLAHIDHALSLRCDTHEDNKPMRSLLGKCGFQYCGVVYYERNGQREKRIAFDLLL